mgnify:CR=1 FL=1
MNTVKNIRSIKIDKDGSIFLPQAKLCKCGTLHKYIPKEAIYFKSGDAFEGWYWACHCESHLFMPKTKLEAYCE